MIPGTRFPRCPCGRSIHCDPGETRTLCPLCEGLPCPPELQGNVYLRYEARETAEGAFVGYVADGEWRAWRRFETLGAAEAWIEAYGG